jgi:methylated-DNA-[protein]-cysteine S-methyltransferase
MTATHTTIDSPLGELTLVAVDGVLSGIYFPGHWYMPDPDVFGVRSAPGFEPPQRS